TGRAPFVAADPMDVLNQVLEQDPVPPSRLAGTVPRDLETICLKCLGKHPSRRYAAAKDLADDLSRFRNGEPIHARRTGPIERGGKWARGRPGVSLLLTACGLLVAALFAGGLWYNAQLRQARDDAVAKERETRRAWERAEFHGDRQAKNFRR